MKISSKIKTKRILGAFAVLAMVAFVFLYGVPVQGGAVQNFAGWGWSADDNTGYGAGNQQGCHSGA
ncbi:MAG: hypothetical protein ACKOW9_01245 [Candidatus Paceibacterota bacterium]